MFLLEHTHFLCEVNWESQSTKEIVLLLLLLSSTPPPSSLSSLKSVVKIIAFCPVIPCVLVTCFLCFGGTSCLDLEILYPEYRGGRLF